MCYHTYLTCCSSQCNHHILHAWKSILTNVTGNTGQQRVQHGVNTSLRYVSQDTAARHPMTLAIRYLHDIVLWIVSNEHRESSLYYYLDVQMKHLRQGKGHYGIKGCSGQWWVMRWGMAWQPMNSGVSRALQWRGSLSSPWSHFRIGSHPPQFLLKHCLSQGLSQPPVQQQYAFLCISIWLVSKELWLTWHCLWGTSSEPCVQKALCSSWSKAGS